MNIFSPIVERRWQTLADVDAYLDRLATGGFGLSKAGQDVSIDSALRYGTVWACVRAIAETCASLPCILYRRLPNGGKERAVDHRLYDVLHDAPNPEMTAMDYWEAVFVHVLTWGNHYSQIERDAYGAKALWPLDPAKVTAGRDGDGKLQYKYRRPDGTYRYFAFADVFHVHGLSWNGLEGLSPIGYARESIGLGISLDDFASRYFGQGAQPGGVLQHPGRLSPDAAKRLKADWEEKHSGLANAHKVAVLEEGMEWKQLTIPPEDSQFLESREWQAEEIARWFRVPPHKIGLLKRATFSNIEHQAIEWVVDTIRPMLVRVEKAIRRDVMQISDGKRDHYAEFLIDGLLRGDIKTRYEAYAVGRQNGWISADDIRSLENMNPMPNGEGAVYLVNSAMMPIDSLIKKAAADAENAANPPEPAPAPQPEPESAEEGDDDGTED